MKLKSSRFLTISFDQILLAIQIHTLGSHIRLILAPNQLTVICTTCVDCLLRMKLLVFKGSVIENNVPVAELSVSICLSRWPDSSSEIESLRKQVLYESSVGIAGLKDSSGLYTFGLRLCIALLLKLMVSRNADTIIPETR